MLAMGEGKELWEFSVPSAQFCFELKTALKKTKSIEGKTT
jgi:hypothetical protein